MGKIGWLVWEYEDSEFPELRKHEPSWYYRKVQIVYFEIEEQL